MSSGAQQMRFGDIALSSSARKDLEDTWGKHAAMFIVSKIIKAAKLMTLDELNTPVGLQYLNSEECAKDVSVFDEEHCRAIATNDKLLREGVDHNKTEEFPEHLLHRPGSWLDCPGCRISWVTLQRGKESQQKLDSLWKDLFGNDRPSILTARGGKPDVFDHKFTSSHAKGSSGGADNVSIVRTSDVRALLVGMPPLSARNDQGSIIPSFSTETPTSTENKRPGKKPSLSSGQRRAKAKARRKLLIHPDRDPLFIMRLVNIKAEEEEAAVQLQAVAAVDGSLSKAEQVSVEGKTPQADKPENHAETARERLQELLREEGLDDPKSDGKIDWDAEMSEYPGLPTKESITTGQTGITPGETYSLSGGQSANTESQTGYTGKPSGSATVPSTSGPSGRSRYNLLTGGHWRAPRGGRQA